MVSQKCYIKLCPMEKKKKIKASKEKAGVLEQSYD